MFGNLDYVNAAIETAVEAGRRVGEIYASTVVDDPGEELLRFINNLFSTDITSKISQKDTKSKNIFKKVTEINEEVLPFEPEAKKNIPESKRQKSKQLSVTKISRVRNVKKFNNIPKSESLTSPENSLPESTDKVYKAPEENNEFLESEKPVSTIERLRMEALGLESKKRISKTNPLVVEKKPEESKMPILSNEIGKVDFDAIKKMNVHKLRHYAREFLEFPIKGREISRANRDELVELFKSISNK